MENVSFKDFLLRVQSIDEKRETSSGPLKVRELNEEITQFLSTLIEPKHSILPVLAHIISEQKIYEDLEYAKVYLQDYFINDVEDIEKITSKEIENLLKHITHRNYRDEILHPKTVYSKYYYNHYTAYCALELFYNVWAVISYLRNNPETHDLSIITFNLGMWLEKQAAYKRAYGLCFIQEEIPK